MQLVGNKYSKFLHYDVLFACVFEIFSTGRNNWLLTSSAPCAVSACCICVHILCTCLSMFCIKVNVNVKVKVKFTLQQATKAKRGVEV